MHAVQLCTITTNHALHTAQPNVTEVCHALRAVQLCIIDVDHAEEARTMKHHGFLATYIGLQPESSETMLRNIEIHVAEHPLPGYEPEDAAALMLQVSCARWASAVCSQGYCCLLSGLLLFVLRAIAVCCIAVQQPSCFRSAPIDALMSLLDDQMVKGEWILHVWELFRALSVSKSSIVRHQLPCDRYLSHGWLHKTCPHTAATDATAPLLMQLLQKQQPPASSCCLPRKFAS